MGRHTDLVESIERWPNPIRRQALNNKWLDRARGPFAFQPNTSTRAYEYPWAYDQVAALGPSRILEIGGALSGLQFVLAKDGHDVHNVDPFLDLGVRHYDLDPIKEHARLNRSFRTRVTLHRTTLPEAGLTGTFGAVLCISTIEHMLVEDITATLLTAKELLAPGGLLVLSVDLFLDIAPFSKRTSNRWGTNASIAWIQDLVGLEMVFGDRSELYGYSDFSTERTLSRLDELAIATGYPQMAQLVTFQSPRTRPPIS